MEPMCVGSTPSPASPAVNPGFLPNFLIEDLPLSTPQNGNALPGHKKTPSSFRNKSNAKESQTLRQKLFSQAMAESPIPSSQSFEPVNEKVGPPKTSLFDALDSAKRPVAPILSSTVAQNESGLFNESLSRMHPEESFYRTNSFNSSRQNGSGEHWVTVFGFPSSVLSQVLCELSNCGVVADKYVPHQGNWVDVKFNNNSEVSRALALNGKCINANVMIGVQVRRTKENKENSSISTPNRARSLRHSFISPQPSNSVIPSQTVPHKSTGIVSKAMEYVFGW
uniref:Nucleoporin NUP35 n=1 Tax=Dendroctonus ponderosae TaxID=77166 RepID=J3JT95_DENPD|nr:unknown [Dendroctonus ponderosae]